MALDRRPAPLFSGDESHESSTFLLQKLLQKQFATTAIVESEKKDFILPSPGSEPVCSEY